MRTSANVDQLLAAPLMVPHTPAEVTARCDATFALVSGLKTGLEAQTGKATIAGTFKPFDDLNLVLGSVSG